jgi:hypothetical protein
MSRISRYQEGILKFLKTKSFINDTTETTKNILYELIDLSDHIPAILCLTILNNQCKKYNLNIHGYYLASGIDALMLLAKVCSSREHFDNKYGQVAIDNMIMEVISCFYKCITQNIDTLRLSKNGNINGRITQLCIEYSTKMMPLITQKNIYNSMEKMKKTDLLCMHFDDKTYIQYKKKNRLEKDMLLEDTKKRYGTVCKLAMSLGWILGLGADDSLNNITVLSEEKTIPKLELLAEYMGTFLKLHDDFKYLRRDILLGRFSLNYVINYGIKEAYTELTEAKANIIEGSMTLDIETKTSKEIIDMVARTIEEIVKDVSVDMDTQYDDVSTL